MNPFHFYNLEDSDYHQSNPNYDNSQFCSSQVPVTETFETSESTGKQARAIKWNAAEDVALMSAWCLASENSVVGKNQRKSLWSKVKELYDATLAENPEKIGKRNEDQMRGRWKRLNENAQKWVAAYREAYRNKTSGMGLKDIESNAHVLSGRAPNVSYIVNGRENNMAYYLTDGIYPPWAAFIRSITSPQLQKHKLFAKHQEAVRKDVERAFGVLQARFAFIRRPCLVWDKDMIGKIMIACIILHNMIVEDERDTYLNYYDPSEFLNDVPINQQQTSHADSNEQPFYSTQRIANLTSYMTNRA